MAGTITAQQIADAVNQVQINGAPPTVAQVQNFMSYAFLAWQRDTAEAKVALAQAQAQAAAATASGTISQQQAALNAVNASLVTLLQGN